MTSAEAPECTGDVIDTDSCFPMVLAPHVRTLFGFGAHGLDSCRSTNVSDIIARETGSGSCGTGHHCQWQYSPYNYRSELHR